MAGPSYPPSVVTSFALGPMPSPAAASAPVQTGLAPAVGDFMHSAAFGLLLLGAIFLYIHQRVL
jgi:hypothetical protein